MLSTYISVSFPFGSKQSEWRLHFVGSVVKVREDTCTAWFTDGRTQHNVKVSDFNAEIGHVEGIVEVAPGDIKGLCTQPRRAPTLSCESHEVRQYRTGYERLLMTHGVEPVAAAPLTWGQLCAAIDDLDARIAAQQHSTCAQSPQASPGER